MNSLAIIIPYYKIDFFEETLASVAAQTDNRFTLYIGNDASPDNPLPLIEKYLGDFSYMYFEYTENLGGKNLALQWERVLENITEEWFQILGDDDTISENFVEEFYKNLSEINSEKINTIKVSQYFIDENTIVTSTKTQYKKISKASELWLKKKMEGHRSSLSEHIFRCSVYEKVKFQKFPLAWYSDDMAVLEISEFGNVFFIDNANVKVRFSDKSISGSENSVYENEKIKSYFLFHERLLNNYKNHFQKIDVQKITQDYLYQCWKSKKTPKLNLISVYLYTQQYKNLLKLPKTYYIFNKNRKN